jgi:hypothetical protein
MIRLSQICVPMAALPFLTALTEMEEVPTHVSGSHFCSEGSQVVKSSRDVDRQGGRRPDEKERGAAGGDSWNERLRLGLEEFLIG